MMNGYVAGLNLARKIVMLKTSILWKNPKLLKRIVNKRDAAWEKPPKEEFWKKFLEGFNANKNISHIMCESCRAPGMDWKAEQHGWHYHGYHIWSCPKCKKHDEKFMQKAQEYYDRHKAHIEYLSESADTSFKPCDEDIDHPDLWKPGSWMWFFENEGWK